MAKSWYILHVYSGYENKIEKTIRMLIDSGELSRDIVTDVKVPTEEISELKEGKNFSIIELNGAGSEPTHIYDPKHSIWFAWQEITRHLNYLYQISKKNRLSGFRALTTIEGIRMLQANKRHVQLLKSVS